MKNEQLENLKIKYKAYLFDDILSTFNAKDYINEEEFLETLGTAFVVYEKFELFTITLMEE